MKITSFFMLTAALAGTGCHVTPVGPMADLMRKEQKAAEAGESKNGKPQSATAKKVEEVPAPIIQSAPPPPLPAMLVTPGEITEKNYQDSVRRLMEEMESDRKSMDSMPRYSEVSVIKK